MSDLDNLNYFNGINGSTGEYETPPLTVEQLAKLARGEQLDPDEIRELQDKSEASKAGGHWGVKDGVDANDLAQCGWGVIFAFDDNDKVPAVKEALQPLLDLRRGQAGPLYKEFVGPASLRPNESKNDFLVRHGMGPGPAEPEKVPYYLLLVGDPEKIPFRFQSQLDVQYAVGRIHFDRLDDYAAYARAVAQAEAGQFLPRRASFFGVANKGDRATELSAKELVTPLAELLQAQAAGWTVETTAPEAARKARLAELLGGGPATPSLLFTASHGMGFDLGDDRQLKHQGALLCQDWAGQKGRIGEDLYFSADDVASNANLLGLLAFFFACYGAGTPKVDDFAHKTGKRAQIAPRPFLAQLPLRLLSRGALAVIGHVERAWGTSFMWGRAGAQLGVFESALTGLMEGKRLGHVFETFNERYAEISSDLSVMLEDIKFDTPVEDSKLATQWTANNDARGYMIVGDPAVKLPLAAEGAAAGRPELAATIASPGAAAPAAAAAVTRAQAEGAPAASASFAAADETNYDLRSTLQGLQSGVENLIQQLKATLKSTLDDVTTLEVRTYVSDNLAGVGYDTGAKTFSNAKLRAYTCVALDGDTVNCMPERGGKLDADLWQAHLAMVNQAQANRAEMLKTAATLLGALKGL
ncbi:MAG: hypothetical protein JNK29_00680 [Anaerolineales bacterium]|nr:hypothetical protein [Anaerolineales bacterium]